MKYGKLKQSKNGEWVIRYKMEDDLIATDGGEMQIHSNHKLWLLIHGRNGMEVCFEFEDTLAKLKSCGPDTHEYIQD